MIADNPEELLKRFVDEFECDVPNLRASIDRVGVGPLEMAGRVQSSFVPFLRLLLSSKAAFLRRSAFVIYGTDTAVLSRHALREALCGYYTAAGVLLRGALEALIRGAFWECMAHKRFRGAADVVGSRTWEIEGTRRNILSWFDDIIAASPSVETALESSSAAIFDKVAPLFDDRVLHRIIPRLRTMVGQLAAWEGFEPLADPVGEIYEELYWSLSAEAHLIPDMTLMGRRLAAGKEALPFVEPSPVEFNSFLSSLTRVADIGGLVVLNLLRDDFRAESELRQKLTALEPVASEIGLVSTAQRIRTLAM
jgi:hypothetical protein